MEWVPGTLSVIGVGNIPLNWTQQRLVKVLSRKINDKFSVIDFRKHKTMKTSFKKGKMRQLNSYRSRTALVRLPGYLDPSDIISKIDGTPAKNGGLNVFTPEPGALPEKPSKKKKVKLLNKQLTKRHENIDVDDRPEAIFMHTQEEIQRELQTKYLGLYKLSLTVDHRLLADVSEIIYERLAVLIKELEEPKSCYSLSQYYRRAHPHDTDFPLIASTLHRIQDEMRLPRSCITEKQLLAVRNVPIGSHHNIPLSELNASVEKYIKRITSKVRYHIGRLSLKPPLDNEDQTATIKVRHELKQQLPYITEITREVLVREILPNITATLHVRIYGEPYMPPREKYEDLLKTVGARAVMRYRRIYNCIWLTVPPEKYTKFMELDGTVLQYAKLICRPSQVPLYKLSASIKDRIRAMFGVTTPLDTTARASSASEHEQDAEDDIEDVMDDNMEHVIDDDMEDVRDDDMEEI